LDHSKRRLEQSKFFIFFLLGI